MFVRNLFRKVKPVSSISMPAARRFGAMDLLNWDLFDHKFTSEMNFVSSFDKMKCFRVIDENGEVVTPGYTDMVSDEKLLQMYDAMITINEAD